MFGLNDFVSTIIVSILCLFIVIVLVIPNIFKLKNKFWFIIQIAILILLISFVIVFSDASLDTYYFLGSFLGLGFLVKGILNSSKFSLILFLFSFISFSLIFLSIGQTIIFIICICYAYTLTMGFTVFLLYKNKSISNDFLLSKTSQLSSFIVLMVFPIISIFILLFLSQNDVIHFESISLYSLFSHNYEILALLIVFLVFFIIMITVFVIDFRSINKQRSEGSWFS